MKLYSSAFRDGEPIPERYTCDGEDISPPLRWEGAPKNTLSFVLICDDPDAPMGTWTHWVLYNIPNHIHELKEGIGKAEEQIAIGAYHAKNSWGRYGYGGPCPPSGTHRYFFYLYAVDTLFPPGLSKQQLLQLLQEHQLAKATLMGTYSFKKK